MASDEELKEIEMLGRKIGRIMGFDDLDLTIEKDKKDIADVMCVRYSLPFKCTLGGIIKFSMGRIRERIVKRNNYKPISTLRMKLILGKDYKSMVNEGLSHELGHARFGVDHPFLDIILGLLSLPCMYPYSKLSTDNKGKFFGTYLITTMMSSALFFPYGMAPVVPLLAVYANEYIAGLEARKRGLKTTTFVLSK